MILEPNRWHELIRTLWSFTMHALHVLSRHLPAIKTTNYNHRPRTHGFTLPVKDRLLVILSLRCFLQGFIVIDFLVCGLSGFLTHFRFFCNSIIRSILNLNNPHNVIGLSCGCFSWDPPVFILIVCNKQDCIVLYYCLLLLYLAQ